MKNMIEALKKEQAALSKLEAPAEFEANIGKVLQNRRKVQPFKTAVKQGRICAAAVCILILCLISITWYIRRGIDYPDTVINPSDGNYAEDNSADIISDTSDNGEFSENEPDIDEPERSESNQDANEKAWTDAAPYLNEHPYYFDFSTYAVFDELVETNPREMLLSGLKHPNRAVQWYSIYKMTEYLDLFSGQEVRELLMSKDNEDYYGAPAFTLAVLNKQFDNDSSFVNREGTKDYLFCKYHEAAYNDGKVWMVRNGRISLLSVHDGSIGSLNWSPDGKWAVVSYGGRNWESIDLVNTNTGQTTPIDLWNYIVDNAQELGYTIGANMRPDPFTRFVEFSQDLNKMLVYILFNDDNYDTQQCTAVYNIQSGLFEQITPVEEEPEVIEAGEYSW